MIFETPPPRWRLLGAGMLAVLNLLSMLGEWVVAFDLLAIAQPGLAILGLLACALLLGKQARRNRIAPLLALAAACGAPLARPGVPTMPACGRDEPAVLRLVVFNVWHENQRVAETAAWIRAQRPDMLVLVEASGRSAPMPALLRDELPYRRACHPRAPCSTWAASRTPLLRATPLARGDPQNRKALSAVVAEIGVGGARATIVSTHLSRPLPLGRQARELAQLDAALQTARVIVAGDFNSTPGTALLTRFARSKGLGRASPTGATWPALAPLLAIDHILAGPGWGLASIRRGPALGSDHRPLVADLCLRSRNPPDA